MSASTTATMTSAIPQRPSGPPNTPLPPLPKNRKPLPDTPDLPESRPGSAASAIPTPATKPTPRSVTSSGLPTPKPTKALSTPAVPTLNTIAVAPSPNPSSPSPPSSAIPTPGKTVRKTTSIGNFPVPPKIHPRVSSLPPSPLSTSASTSDVNGATRDKTRRISAQHRSSEGGTRRPKARSSGYGLRSQASSASGFGVPPSLLNGTGDSNLISSAEGARGSDGLLGLPSPPQSRSSSVNESYTTDGTQFEEMDDSTERGRPKSQGTITDGKRNSHKDSKGNVLVSVRVRPDAAGGEGNRTEGEWLVDGRRSLISYKGREGGDYRYDNVFSPHDHNARVYDNAAKRLVRRVMEGYHGTVFAYGMTGTGKTFSMQGTANSPGVIPLAITDIFSYIRENPNREFLLRVSYLEIYNEKIYDLLSQSSPGQVQQEEIKLREDSKRGVYATPLKEEIVQSPNQLLRVIARGDVARRTGSTQYNARSSRSHAVVQIVVESRERAPSHGAYFEKENRRTDRILPGGVLVSTLSLIDLAGSEKAAENKERRTEGAHINKSLLTLGTVIGRLSGDDDKDKDEAGKGAGKDKDKVVKHLPYRDSKLTRLLQPALSGNSLVSILCTIQLSSAGTSAAATGLHTGETLNTLKFASRAKNNIVSHAKRNESNPNDGDPGSRALLDRYKLEIQELRAQLEQQSKSKEEAEKHEELEEERKREEELEQQERTRHEEQMLEIQLARTALKERISHLNRLILSSKSIGVNSVGMNSGRMSSMSTLTASNNRMSTFSTNEFGATVSMRDGDSIHSTRSTSFRDSSATLEASLLNEPSQNRSLSAGSITPEGLPAPPILELTDDDNSALIEEEDLEDSAGPRGDGEASLAQQNRMLQADLADKNRYIATLEKRLLQARRTSHSRVSMGFASRVAMQEDGGAESLLLAKDREIEELRVRLDDQTRMVTALRSAARKRGILEIRTNHSLQDASRPAKSATVNRGSGVADSIRSSVRSARFANGSSHMSTSSTASHSSSGAVNVSKTPLSPMALLSPSGSEKSDGPTREPESRFGTKTSRRKSVDEMTVLLDQMIQDKVDSGHVGRDRGSLRVKRDTVMEKNGLDHAPGTKELWEIDELD